MGRKKGGAGESVRGSTDPQIQKNRQMTLQQLADRIHKSRASVSKYETGEVSLDIVTLTEIARVLEVQPGQLVDLPVQEEEGARLPSANSGISPFFRRDGCISIFMTAVING